MTGAILSEARSAVMGVVGSAGGRWLAFGQTRIARCRGTEAMGMQRRWEVVATSVTVGWQFPHWISLTD